MRYVDLDAIKADLERQMDRSNPNWSFTNEAACYDLLEYLDKFPVIDPVKHGKWVETREDYLPKYYCSACGHIAYFDCDDERYVRFDYCPYCGADMRGEDNG